mmetsp:Transcript_18614/g.42537  ORF Transcript_18614/g.42537 Transcript_18614/m.42537 type:complete len:466 (-) Transcript_18614:203-1600(-)
MQSRNTYANYLRSLRGRRAIFAFPDGTKMSLLLYRTVSTKRRPQPVVVHQTKNVQLKKITKHFADNNLLEEVRPLDEEEQGKELDANTSPISENNEDKSGHKIRTYVEVGMDRIPFAMQDIAAAAKKCADGIVLASEHASSTIASHNCNSSSKTPSHPTTITEIHLVGFRPLPPLPSATAHLLLDGRTTSSVLPDDSVVAGTKKALHALLAGMDRRRVYALCTLVTLPPPPQARRARPRPAQVRSLALIPPMAAHGGRQGAGAGRPRRDQHAVLIELPFRDDVRLSREAEKSQPAPQETVEAMRDLVRHQSLGNLHWGENFVNPALREFWEYVEKLALGSPSSAYAQGECDDGDDTELDEEAVLAAAGPQVQRLTEILEQIEEDEGKETGRRKKLSVEDWDGDNIDWEKLVAENRLEECTADLLRCYLGVIGEKRSGNKSALVERVWDHLQSGLSCNKHEMEHTI